MNAVNIYCRIISEQSVSSRAKTVMYRDIGNKNALKSEHGVDHIKKDILTER